MGNCFLRVAVIAAAFACSLSAGAATLTEAQEERLEKYLPRTYAKLARREPVAIAGLGDGVVMNQTHDKDRFDVRYGFLGRFAQRLERQFFYTGGVTVLDSATGKVYSREDYRGPVITIQGLGRENAPIMQAFQRLTTDAFLYNPDLVVLGYGVSDAVSDYPREVFGEALDRAVGLCLGAGVDVIVVGAPATMVSEGPVSLGLERPFVDTARKVAEKRGVLFVDAGRALVEGGGISPNVPAKEIFLEIEARVKRHFDHGKDAEDFLYPNARAQEFLGDEVFRRLLEGSPLPRYSVSGHCIAIAGGRLRVEFDLKNESAENQAGFLCTLDSGRWATSTDPHPYHAFDLRPGDSAHFSMDYQLRHSPVYKGEFAFERWGGGALPYVPLLVADASDTRFAGFDVRQMPIQVDWHTGFQDEVREAFKMGCKVTNTSGRAIEGEFSVEWVEQKVTGPFSLKKDEEREFEITVKLPQSNSVLSIRSALDTVFVVDKEEYRFRREVEAMQNLNLGQRVPLLREDLYSPNTGLLLKSVASNEHAFVHAAASEKALHVVYELPAGIELKEGEKTDSLIAELRLDARAEGQRRTGGFVEAIRIRKKGAADGSGVTDAVPVGAFGNGYNKRLDPGSISSELKTGADGVRRFTITIPRPFFHLHEWRIGIGNSLLGILPSLRIPDRSESGMNFVFAAGRLAPEDPHGLTVMELSGKPTGRWSVRLY